MKNPISKTEVMGHTGTKITLFCFTLIFWDDGISLQHKHSNGWTNVIFNTIRGIK